MTAVALVLACALWHVAVKALRAAEPAGAGVSGPDSVSGDLVSQVEEEYESGSDPTTALRRGQVGFRPPRS